MTDNMNLFAQAWDFQALSSDCENISLANAKVAICPSLDEENQNTVYVKEFVSDNALSTTATWQTVGGGSVLRVAGNSSNLTIPTHSVFSLNSSRSYSLWWLSDDENSSYLASDHFQIHKYRYTNETMFAFIAGIFPSGNHQIWYYNAPTTVESLCHTVFTWDGTSPKLYFNGVEVSPATSSSNGTPILGTTSPFWFYSQNEYEGFIFDDFRAFDRVLTESEIELLATGRGVCLLSSEGESGGEGPDYGYGYGYEDDCIADDAIHAWMPHLELTGTTLIDRVGNADMTLDGSEIKGVGIEGPALKITNSPLPSMSVATRSATYNNTTGTVSLWVRRISTGGQILSFDSYDPPFQILLSASGIYYENRGGGSIWGGNLTQNEWYHICCTYQQNDDCSIYVNGELIATQTSENYPFSITQIYLGSTYQNPFHGYLDNIRIYDRVLTPSEITQLASSRTAVLECTDEETGNSGNDDCDPIGTIQNNGWDVVITFENVIGGSWRLADANTGQSDTVPYGASDSEILNILASSSDWSWTSNIVQVQVNVANANLIGVTIQRINNPNDPFTLITDDLIGGDCDNDDGCDDGAIYKDLSATITGNNQTSDETVVANSLSVSGWANVTSPYGTLLSVGNASIYAGSSYELHYYINGTWIQSTYSNSTWIHFAWTYNYDTGEVKCYKNGTLLDTAAGTTNQATNHPVELNSGGPLYANLENIRIYNRVLSNSEVSELSASRDATLDCTQTHNETSSGGVVCNSTALPTVDFYSVGTGSFVLSSQSEIDSGDYIEFSRGGLKISGSTAVGIDSSSTGGLVLTSKSTSVIVRLHRKIRIWANTVAQDLNAFYLGVVIDEISTAVDPALYVLTESGTKHDVEVRQYDGTKMILYFSCNLFKDVNNDFYLWEVIDE